MQKSDSIEMLASSLSKFQGEIQNCFKSKTGYGYKYADLASILDEVRPLLAKHDLSLMQMPGNAGDCVSLETMIMHKSGQWVAESMQIPVDGVKGMSRAQAIGSVISYARRYALTSFLGIAQTDEDTDAAPAFKTHPDIVQQFTAPPSKTAPHSIFGTKLVELNVSKELVRNTYQSMGYNQFTDIPEERFEELLSLVKNGVVNE